MEEKKVTTPPVIQDDEQESSFNFAAIYKSLVLNWPWFVASLLICFSIAAIYLRYATPVYNTGAKFLVKTGKSSRSAFNFQSGGVISTAAGLNNEMEILKTTALATEAVRAGKLYVSYEREGTFKNEPLYKNQPITVDIDEPHLDILCAPIDIEITRKGKEYNVSATYSYIDRHGIRRGPYEAKRTFTTFPYTFSTKAGQLTFNRNGNRQMGKKDKIFVHITTPARAAGSFKGRFKVTPMKSTSIIIFNETDVLPRRACDYLKNLATVYNISANDDKNEVAIRTEQFINDRIEKINAELGDTEGALKAYKQRNKLVQLSMNASRSFGNSDELEKRVTNANTQLALINSLTEDLNNPSNKYEVIPTNIGLSDGASTGLVHQYNELALKRKRLLQGASESSPQVQTINTQLDELSKSVKDAFAREKKNFMIQRDATMAQYQKYAAQVNETPEFEQVLSQIGRQQNIKSGLYMLLLQKREENSISLAATADKGKLLDDPVSYGMISPKKTQIWLIALLAGLLIPALILWISSLLRYKIEGHEDVAKLTKLPILADVAVASDTAKTKADIVVHENQNNQMEEIFRSMRTNLQFMLKEHDKVIMFTSTTSGEGKTFNASNLAVSFALLGKKVLVVGLDIRKPRLAELFEINDHHHGITPLIAMDNPTWADIEKQILPSGVQENLELLLAGPIAPNPTELMARESLETIFKHLREHYDYVIVDTAPVGLVTDTLQIGRMADATVYMCRADYTPKSSFDLINGLAEEEKLPNMAIVINGIDMSKKKYGYSYGYGKYGKYGRYGHYGRYGSYGHYGRYGHYGSYGNYGHYGTYGNSHYGNKNDTSIKR